MIAGRKIFYCNFFTGNVQLCGLTPEMLRKKCICEKHFNSSDYKTDKKKYLHNLAVPVHYCAVPVYSSENEDLKVLTPSKTYLQRKRSLPITQDSFKERSSRKKLCFDSLDESYVNSVIDMPDQPCSPRKMELKKQLSYQIKKNKYNMSRLSAMKKKLKQVKESKSNFISLSNVKSKIARTLILMQVKGIRQTWYKSEKKLAISLYYKSPNGYRFLRRSGIILPAVSTIQKWLQNSIFKTGVDNTLSEHLKTKAITMTTAEKKCILIFDEMCIKKYTILVKTGSNRGIRRFRSKRTITSVCH